MRRCANRLWLCAGMGLWIAGCTHFLETRSIERFTHGLEQQNLEQLKATTSDQFDQKALRLAESLDDLKILNLPTGDTSIVEVAEISSNKKRVTVQVGESKKEIFYELVRNEHGEWVVDDIYLRQKRKGVVAYASVTDQMDLLLTVREVLTAWRDGTREQVLATTTPELRQEIAALPPSYLAELTRRVTGQRPKGAAHKPKAEMEEKLAVVTLPRIGGATVFTFAQLNDGWKLSDVAIDARDKSEHLSSLRKLAIAVNSGLAFLKAYEQNDKSALAEITDADFFKGSLSVGELSQVKLPSPQLAEHELEVNLTGAHADLLLRNEQEIVKVAMLRVQDDEPSSQTRFLVQDVTIYEVASSQEKRLSALFTARAMMEIFWSALSTPEGPDLDNLRHASTKDFTGRVWEKLNPATLADMPLAELQSAPPQVVEMRFEGALTSIVARHGDLQVTYQLREMYGRFYVDDVLLPVQNRPSSLKRTLQILIPVQEFIAGIEFGQVDLLRRYSSSDFNRNIWTQTEQVPDIGLAPVPLLRSPMKSVELTDGGAVVTLGNAASGARVTLVSKQDQYFVDDVLLIGGANESQQVAFKNALRRRLLQGLTVESAELATPAETEQAPPPPSLAQELEPIEIGPLR